MSEIILCRQPLSTHYLKDKCGISIDSLSGTGCAKPESLAAYTPYLLNGGNASDRSIMAQLSPMPVARELTHLSLSFGADNTLALAQMTHKLQEYNVSLLGASTSIYADRIGGFAGAVKNYQDALMEYQSTLKSAGSGTFKTAIKPVAIGKRNCLWNRVVLR